MKPDDGYKYDTYTLRRELRALGTPDTEDEVRLVKLTERCIDLIDELNALRVQEAEQRRVRVMGA